VLKQVTSTTFASEKRFEKIRNAEMGKFAVHKCTQQLCRKKLSGILMCYPLED